MSDFVFSRRRFLQLAGALTLSIQGCSVLSSKESTEDDDDFLSSFGSVQKNLGLDEPQTFFGDSFRRAHSALWDVEGFLKKNAVPARPDAHYPVVVLGGGLSGLSTAYLLRDLKPLVLEQGPRFGGNSQAQTWRGVPYSIGAAYFPEPDSKSEIGKFLSELGVLEKAKASTTHGAISAKQLWTDFFSGAHAEKNREVYRRFVARMKRYSDQPELYPNIPSDNPKDRKWVAQFDGRSFLEQVRHELGGEIPGELLQWIEHYCWSSFGASAGELSAAAGIHFLASEFGTIRFFPEGNAAITQALLEKLAPTLTGTHLRADSLALQVKKEKTGLWSVLFLDGQQQVRKVTAQSVVFACPKFVAAKLMPEMSPLRMKAIQSVKYRSYLVANVLVDGPYESSVYDSFVLDPSVAKLSIEEQAKRVGVTDVVSATYRTSSRHTVFTLYRAFPYDSGRSEIFAQGAWEKFRAQTQSQLEELILPALKIDPARVKGVRMARWGHPMAVPQVGSYKSDLALKLHEPIQGSAFFVHQDNWLLPSMETSVGEALRWAPRIRASLGQIAKSASELPVGARPR